MITEHQNGWVVTQIGAREHYAVARALKRRGCLEALVTDLWASPEHFLSRIPYRPIRERYHQELGDSFVLANNLSAILWEMQARLKRLRGDRLFMARNVWFEKEAIKLLEGFLKKKQPEPQVLFAYSYAALEILKWAKGRGWKTVLGQIDPGIEEEKIVASLSDQNANLAGDWHRIDPAYWERWKEECAIADCIMVNSAWSKKLVSHATGHDKKIKIVPLAYEAGAIEYMRTYPKVFTSERPLRVLFLGQVTLRKGIVELLEAAKILEKKPIEFWVVGLIQINLKKAMEMLSRKDHIKFIGPVARSEVESYYQKADVFLFPTHSDGFGITQLEAQRRKLPLIVSQRCGEVVKDGFNGSVLRTPSGEEIARVLTQILETPEVLRYWSENSKVESRFSFQAVGDEIMSLV
jgi:glycosyltransferase involved in cell wall biosynthesis